MICARMLQTFWESSLDGCVWADFRRNWTRRTHGALTPYPQTPLPVAPRYL